MAGAAFHTGASKQDYKTPREFIGAVEREFGKLHWDLAAHAGNAVCGPGRYFGPDQDAPIYRDAFGIDWTDKMWSGGPLWLNPPFSSIKPWVEKCARTSEHGAEILLLVPASVGSNWFWDYVAPYAHVYALSPRLSFDGKNPFPKDLILAHYAGTCAQACGFSCWKWKES